jgi:glycerol-3-phosphate dehydrogenase
MFAGLRPLIRKKDISATAMLNRDHTIIVSQSGLVTVSGGKWTTYRRIAEDVISKVAVVAGLPQAACVTKTLRIGNADKNRDQYGANFLHTEMEYSEKDIAWFVEHEMAMTVEDVLARRTRLLFLNAAAAVEKAPSVARQLAGLFNKDEKWINEQVNSFYLLARQYILQPE